MILLFLGFGVWALGTFSYPYFISLDKECPLPLGYKTLFLPFFKPFKKMGFACMYLCVCLIPMQVIAPGTGLQMVVRTVWLLGTESRFSTRASQTLFLVPSYSKARMLFSLVLDVSMPFCLLASTCPSSPARPLSARPANMVKMLLSVVVQAYTSSTQEAEASVPA